MSLIRLTEVYFDAKNKEKHHGILVNSDRILRVEPSMSEEDQSKSIIYFNLADYIFVVESIDQLEKIVAESSYPNEPLDMEMIRLQHEAINGVP